MENDFLKTNNITLYDKQSFKVTFKNGWRLSCKQNRFDDKLEVLIMPPDELHQENIKKTGVEVLEFFKMALAYSAK